MPGSTQLKRLPSRAVMLARMLASDQRADGHFITGVVSTGIYCLPSCRARKPKPKNVVFYRTPEAARLAGLRPCKRCRPDESLAEGEFGQHAGEALSAALVDRIRANPGSYRTVGDVAKGAGVSASTLHELIRRHFHSTPAELLSRARVCAAQHALLSTEREVSDIAFSVGFGSLSAFGANFRQLTAMTPLAFRNLLRCTSFELALPPDYPLKYVLHSLSRDQFSLTERVEDQRYTTVLRLNDVLVNVQIDFCGNVARCTLTSAQPLDTPQWLQLHQRLLGLLGLHASPRRFEALVSGHTDLKPLLNKQSGLRVLLLSDLFDALIWSIVGQQVSVRFACTLRRRLVERCGTPFLSGSGAICPATLYAPPTPQAIAALDVAELLPLGFTKARAAYLIGAAQAVASGRLPLSDLASRPAGGIERALLAVRGIGPWSAHYLLMRGYGFPDCVPVGDSGLGESLKTFFELEARPDAAETLRLMQRFSPHRSLATVHFWRRLNIKGSSNEPACHEPV